MATTTIYTIESTDGVNTLVIQPRTINGANGVLRNTDLTLYGNATPNWGERFNENFYHLTENFATEEASAGVPKDETDFGETGWGVNAPLQGQLWYNKTDDHLYLQLRPTADLETLSPIWDMIPMMDDVNTAVNGLLPIDQSDVTGLTTALDGKVNVVGDTMTGNLTISQATAQPRMTLNTDNGQDPWYVLSVNNQIAGIVAYDYSPSRMVFRKYHPAGSNALTELAINDTHFLFTSQNGANPEYAKVRCPSTSAGDVGTTMVTKDYVDAEIAALAGGGQADFVNVTGDTMTGDLFINVPTYGDGRYPIQVFGQGGNSDANLYEGGHFVAKFDGGTGGDHGGVLILAGDNNGDEWALKIENPNASTVDPVNRPAERMVFGIKAESGNTTWNTNATVTLGKHPGAGALEAATKGYVDGLGGAAPNIYTTSYPQTVVVDDNAWHTFAHNISFTTQATGRTIINVDMSQGWSQSSWNGYYRLTINGVGIVIDDHSQAHGEGFIQWSDAAQWAGTLSPNTSYTGYWEYKSDTNNAAAGYYVRPHTVILTW